MRMSQLFGLTLREAPADAETSSHKLLVRAGFIRPLAAGIFTSLPLARRTLTKIENIMRQEMEAISGQEMTMPIIHPAELWQETGRWYQIDTEMGRFKDKNNRDMVLAMTHEEVVADLVCREVQSYRHLPRLIYHIQTKWRDDPRPRAGLIRVREFTMKDSYSLDADWEGLDRQYRAHFQAYFNIFNRCALPVIAVKSDVGMMGGKLAHEYMYLTPIGEDTLLICEHCSYSANRQIARFRKPEAAPEDLAALEPVPTPGVKTIEALAQFLDIPEAKTAKAVFLIAEIPQGEISREISRETSGETSSERFIFAVVRGDMEVNETKLANAIQACSLRPATEEEIHAIGAVPGYASPIGLKEALLIADDTIPLSPNLVAGANQEGYHLRNVNYPRDFQADIVTDIASARDGDGCPECGKTLRAVRGVEVGNIFKLGTRYSEAMGCTFLDTDGEQKPVIMGSYGIGSGRLMACIAEEHHDENGLVWPVSVAPFQVHLVVLAGRGSSDTRLIADQLYEDLQAAQIEVLYDDRQDSPGVKFNDADLIGLPIRLTVSERALNQGGVEFKRRDRQDKSILPLAEVIARIQAEIANLQAAIEANLTQVPYTD